MASIRFNAAGCSRSHADSQLSWHGGRSDSSSCRIAASDTQFALFLDMVIVDPATGAREPFTEIALYTVRGGHIAEERFFYD